MDFKEFFKAVTDDPQLLRICANQIEKNRFVCPRCNKPKVDNGYYHVANSLVYKSGRLPICKKCTGELFEYYYDKYCDVYVAMEKICLLFDLCFKKEILGMCEDNPRTIVGNYIRYLNLRQYRKLNTYDLSRKTVFFPYLFRRFGMKGEVNGN